MQDFDNTKGHLKNLRFFRYVCSANPSNTVPVPSLGKPARNLFCAVWPFSALGQAPDRLVTVSSTYHYASTPALSTSSSSRGLRLSSGDLILRGASRLDAFSVYPFPTWLPSCAIGMTTGPPAVGPSRSSRTKDSSSQISYARAG